MILTDAKIKALKPRSSRYMVSDGSGLSLDVLPSGAMTWFYKYRFNGRQQKITLGRYPDLKLRVAREERGKLAVRVARGENPAQEKRQSKLGIGPNQLFRAFVEVFYTDQILPRRKNPRVFRRWLDVDILPSLGGIPLKSVSRSDIKALVNRKKRTAPASARQIRDVCRLIFQHAVDEELIPSNPASRIKTASIGDFTPRNRTLTPDELRQAFIALEASNVNRTLKLALKSLLLSAVRKQEWMGSLWSEVSWDRAELVIPAERMKGRKATAHTVFLSRQMLEILRELQALAGSSPYIFPGRNYGKPFAHSALNEVVKRLQLPAIEPWSPHDLRRTFSTIMNRRGYPADAIEGCLGHSVSGGKIRATYYTGPSPEERRRVMAAWSQIVEDIMSGDLTSNVIPFQKQA